jgi:hypothetical protein
VEQMNDFSIRHSTKRNLKFDDASLLFRSYSLGSPSDHITQLSVLLLGTKTWKRESPPNIFLVWSRSGKISRFFCSLSIVVLLVKWSFCSSKQNKYTVTNVLKRHVRV